MAGAKEIGWVGTIPKAQADDAMRVVAELAYERYGLGSEAVDFTSDMIDALFGTSYLLEHGYLE